MDKVWVVTRGYDSDYGISAIFSTKEKAQEYYNMKSVISYEYNEPEEWNIDKIKTDEYVEMYKYNNGKGWHLREWQDYSEETFADISKGKTLNLVKVHFNYDKDVMRKEADDRLVFLKAQKAGIA